MMMMMMMMIGDHPNPTVQIPSWDQDPTAHIHSPSQYDAALTALQRFLPSNKDDVVFDNDEYDDVPADAFSCDDFRMFEFKVKRCARARSHDWTECPFAHPGEKARRRDPRRYRYSGSACPDFRRGACRRGDACEHAHGVFECWLHPSRYRTQPCKDGAHCRRRVCFFAHSPDQLRVLPASPDGSPRTPGSDPFSASPPLSPMRGLQLNKMNMSLGLGLSPPAWGVGFGSPRGQTKIRPGFMSLPTTPIRAMVRPGLSPFDTWEATYEEEPVMERVESGKMLREKIYAKLGQENSLGRVNRADSVGPVPDVGWVFEIVD